MRHIQVSVNVKRNVFIGQKKKKTQITEIKYVSQVGFSLEIRKDLFYVAKGDKAHMIGKIFFINVMAP